MSGRCLCKNVSYEISKPPISQGVCYCIECQRAGGAFGGPLLVIEESSFKCQRSELSYYPTKSDDGSIVRRYFCTGCGVHIYSSIDDVPQIITVKAATLDQFCLFAPEYLVWTRSAAPTCRFPAGVPTFAEEAPLDLLLGS